MTPESAWTLLLVDLQNDYFPGGLNPLAGAEEAVANARLLLERARALGQPVFHVRHLATPQSPFFRPGTEGAEIHGAVRPRPGEAVVEKRFPNAFRGTPLLEQLRAAGQGRLMVAGMMTHMCVDATVRAAADHGFALLLAGDACATKPLAHAGVAVPPEQVHAAFLAALASAYAEVKTTAELLEALA